MTDVKEESLREDVVFLKEVITSTNDRKIVWAVQIVLDVVLSSKVKKLSNEKYKVE